MALSGANYNTETKYAVRVGSWPSTDGSELTTATINEPNNTETQTTPLFKGQTQLGYLGVYDLDFYSVFPILVSEAILFDPPAGTYNSAQSVSISCPTGGTIRYTTDGSEPVAASTAYSVPIVVAKTTTCRAKLFGSTIPEAITFSADYSLVAATPIFSLKEATYSSDQTVTLSSTTPGALIYYSTDGSDPTTASTAYKDHISVAGHGTVKTIKAIAVATGFAASGVGNATYTIDYPATATPNFSPVAGVYTTDQNVTITCTTEAASIYYTIDGSVPTTASTFYSGSIGVAGNGTIKLIKAIATAVGLAPSGLGNATYTIAYLPSATPTFSPPSGPYMSDQSVTISCGTPSTIIWYTTDGSNPSNSITRQSGASPVGPIAATVNPATMIRAVSIAAGYLQSAEGSSKYVEPLLSMVSVPSGSFNFGASTVNISAFRMSKYEVTQKQYQTVMGVNPSFFSESIDAANCPVEQVTWYDAVEFCNKLSEREGLENVFTITGRNPAMGYPITGATVTQDVTKNGYSLPRDAQWEYAARGGPYSQGFTYAGSNSVMDVAWYVGNSEMKTHGVGTKAANELGLFDLSGNVWEWCWDWWSDPAGVVSSTVRVDRGGHWHNQASDCMVGSRSAHGPGNWDTGLGIRVVRSP